MQIDFVYFDGCPHASAARERLGKALGSLGLTERWNEWDSADAETPEHLRGFSSPTILVNGTDVERKSPTSGAGCAIGGGPTFDKLRDALALATQ